MAYKVVVVDDFKMIREVLVHAVELSAGFELAAALPSAEQAVAYCKNEPADLVIMDILIPGETGGLDAAAQIKRDSPHTKIILITSMPELSYIRRAKEIGVESFWHKEVQEQTITEIMTRTMSGESVYPTQQPVVLLGKALSTDFTEREADVLRELVGGASNEEIAVNLNITPRTVKAHITNLLKKTGCRSRLELALKARSSGLAIKD